jgi:RNA-directed DNA polymerase
LIHRLARFGLEVAEDKTQIIEFSHCKALAKTKFDFLGFEFRWYVGWKRKPLLKRRTSRTKLRASLANFKSWFKKYSGLPKEIFFAKLNRKLLGYYNYYGVTGNSQSLSSFVYHVTKLLYKWLNRRSHGKFVLQPASRASDSARIFCHLKIIENQPCVANQLAYFLCHAVGAFGFDEAHSEAA